MYNCQFCHSSYVWPHDLTRHIRRKHDTEQQGMHSQRQLEVYSRQQQSRRHHGYPPPPPPLPPPPSPPPPPPLPPPPQETFFRTGRKPVKLRTDKGTEYRNRDVQRLLKREKVDHFFTQKEQKSSYAERAIKTIKPKLSRYMSRRQTHRWIDVLDSATQSYNGSYHRSIKMAPRAVTKRDEARLWKLQYGRVETRKKTKPHFTFKKPADCIVCTTSNGDIEE